MKKRVRQQGWLLVWLVFLLLPFGLVAQVAGRVFDARSNAPMAFVTVVVEGSVKGTTTDIDGRFALASARQGETLLFTFVGYKPYRLSIGEDQLQSTLRIELSAKTVDLEAAEVRPGINPAEVLMRRVIDNRDRNNPENCCPFTYDSYNKLIFSGLLDSAIVGNPEKIAGLDSNDQSIYEYFEEKHLLLMESVSERRFIPPGHSTEEVKASRFSGISNPDFALLGTQLQSFSFYDDEINLLDLRYLSPLHRSAISKYLFVMEDSTYQGSDTLFIVSYRPRSGKNFNGMKGLLYINSNGYALENVLAEPAEANSNDMDIRIRQHYEFIDGRQWFPVQLNTDLVFNNMTVGPYAIMGIGRSYIKNIRLDAPLRRRDVGQIALQMDPMATRRPEAFWSMQRNDSLDSKEMQTYVFIDSVSKAENFDRKYEWLQALASGRVNMGPVDFDLTHLMRFNGYEGFRLGGGLYTSERLMKKITLGGYAAYGFRDRRWKWGTDVRWKPFPRMSTEFKLAFYSDVFERGGQRFPDATGFASNKLYYEFFLGVMDRLEVVEASFSTRLPAYLTLSGGYRQGTLQHNGDYRYRTEVNENISLLSQTMDLKEMDLRLRWSHREVLFQTRRGLAAVNTRNPVIGLSFTAGEVNPAEDAERYYRAGASLEHTFIMPMLGNFSVFMHAGKLFGEAPAFRLFNFRSSGENISIATPFAFETLQAGSAIADEYALIHLRHSFKDLLLKIGKFRPHIVLVHSMGIGELSQPERHDFLGATAPDQGYVESGIELQNLIRSGFTGVGVGGFYRYGAANTGIFADDFFFKITAGFAF